MRKTRRQFGTENVERLPYADLADQFTRRHEVVPLLLTLVFLAFAVEALVRGVAIAAQDPAGGTGRSAGINFLYRLFDPGTDVSRFVGGDWHASRPVPPEWLWRWLSLAWPWPWSTSCPSWQCGPACRFGTFLLRLAALGLLLVTALRRGISGRGGDERPATVDGPARRFGVDGHA